MFLPIPKSGKAEFNPVLFNYQSAPGSPAVLTILVTRQGTSMQVIENKPDEATAAGWGQELYFNNKGQRAAFTAERKSDVEQRIEAQGGPKTEDDKTALQKGADVLFLVQIPLEARAARRLGGALPGSGVEWRRDALGRRPRAAAPRREAADEDGRVARRAAPTKSDVEQAVLGHGPNVGPFNEGHDLASSAIPSSRSASPCSSTRRRATASVSDIDLDGIAALHRQRVRARRLRRLARHARRRPAPPDRVAEGAARVVPLVTATR